VVQGQLHNLYKADLHCHSRHSGPAKHLRFLRCRDCYSQPLDVYRAAKRRGMDLVTITDHDSIDGCLELLDRLGDLPDFIIGEEVSAYFPAFDHTVHIGVYGLNEAQHREIARLRVNAEELIPYLRENNLLFVLNHFFHDFAYGARVREFTERMVQLFDVWEVRNGTQLREHNTFVEALLQRYRKNGRRLSAVGGSDSHTLRRLGHTYTASPARNRQEFLEDIRAGRTLVVGRHANHLVLAADIYGVVLRYYPTVLSLDNGEFPPLQRLKNFFLSILAGPFLIAPYVVAVRHSRIQRARMELFSRLFPGNQPPVFPPPTRQFSADAQ
jgi:predicted metal-dependent phosphoesterase TrpH